MHDELLYFARRPFGPESVSAKPLIHQVHTRSERGIRLGSDKDKETRGDVIIQFLWYQQADAIIDVKLGDADTDYCNYYPMAELLDQW